LTDPINAIRFGRTIDRPVRPRYRVVTLVVLIGVLAALVSVSEVAAQATAAPSRLDIEPSVNRWRLLEPGGIGERPRNPLYDPYTPNVVKGDYPLWGDKIFLSATGVIDTFADFKRNLDYFSGGRFRNIPYHEHNILGQITAVAFLEIFHGDTVFAPKDWALRLAPVMRFRCGDLNATDHGCGEYITLQEGFFELKLFEIGTTFDATSGRVGIQGFNADFFGLIYNDVQPGLRFFSEIDRNQFKVNLAAFDRLNKEKLSALNELDKRREHQVAVVSLQWDDFILPGFNVLPSVLYSHDEAPAVVTPGHLDAWYFGLTANGHIGRFNVAGAVYYVTGQTARNTPTRTRQDISAWTVFAQATYPIHWLNPRLAVAYGTGDDDPTDRDARGFDSVFDNVAFGGGQFSYLFGEKIQLGAITVLRGNSVYPSLRGANATSQYVNPGAVAINPGIDMTLTPTTLFEANYNYVRFDDTSSLTGVAGRRVSNEVGHELNGGVTWRPLLNEQLIVFGGAAVFFPGQGVKDTFGNDDPVYKAVVRVVLTF
jgi:hypothetical protein